MLRLLLDLLGHPGLGDRLLQLLDLGRGALGLAELLLDRLQLLAQDVLALAALDRVPGLLADVARDPEHLDAVLEQLEHLVEPARRSKVSRISCFSSGRRSMKLATRSAAWRGGARRLHGVDQLRRRLRQQLQRLQRLLLQTEQARLDLGRCRLRLLDPLDARGEERMPGHELAHAEALLALADDVMVAVGAVT